jgi:acyl-coenzyme A thioesterase PaaI-like protein
MATMTTRGAVPASRTTKRPSVAATGNPVAHSATQTSDGADATRVDDFSREVSVVGQFGSSMRRLIDRQHVRCLGIRRVSSHRPRHVSASRVTGAPHERRRTGIVDPATGHVEADARLRYNGRFMPQATAPPVQLEEDWQPVSPFPGSGGSRSFVSGDPTGTRLRIAYFLRTRDQRLVGRAWFGPGSEGPPGHVHGGAVAAVLDEAMGAAAWLAGHPSVAAHIEVDYREMIRLGIDARFEAVVTSINGRKILTEARLFDSNGDLLAQSQGLFIAVTDEQRKLIEQFR